MTAFVLDCSVSAAWCLQDEHSVAASSVLESLQEREAVAPELWVSEMGNVLAVAERRGRIDRQDVDSGIRLLARLPVKVMPSSVDSLSALIELRRETGLSAYDATYLELARRLDLPLATFDGALAEAAGDLGIEVLAD